MHLQSNFYFYVFQILTYLELFCEAKNLQNFAGTSRLLGIGFFPKENLLYSVVNEAENLLVIKDNIMKLWFLFHLANS